MDGDLRVSDELTIPASELVFRASRSGGPGGQHVNTSSTGVELVWSVCDSPSLTEAQRELILQRLRTRITAAGEIILAESGSRSQLRNRKVALERLRELLAEAVTPPKPRRRTRPPAAAKEERMREKRRRSQVKKLRRPPDPES